LKGRNYKKVKGQPYTRGKYIHGSPALKISRFTMGDTKTKFPHRVSLLAQNAVQIRQNALEAARVAANKILSDALGETGYFLHLCVYPHIILRENRMIATAGADRLQEGMRRSFGKPSGRAARVKADQALLSIYVNDTAVEHARNALRVSAGKLPTPCRIVVENLASS
jgi:large subunit ribosomal protein L10e